MKYFYLVTLIISISVGSVPELKSQPAYIPLPMQNAFWFVQQQSGSSDPLLMQTCSYFENYKYFPKNDTLIGTKKYIKFYSEYLTGGGGNIGSGPTCYTYTPPTNTLTFLYAVRQDTANKKLFLVYPGNTTEKLMFDFNQVAGDTVKSVAGELGSIPPCGTTKYRIIDSVYYRLYTDGNCHKVYKLKPFANCVNYIGHSEIIEGIGTELGLTIMQNHAEYTSSGVYHWQNNATATLVVNTNTIAAAPTNTCGNMNVSNFNTTKEFELFPNPVNEQLTIAAGDNIEDLKVYSILGSELSIEIFEMINKKILNTKVLEEGSYLVRIKTPNGWVTKKFIKLQ